MSVEYNFSTLESLQSFWEHAVKDIVYVYIKYNLYPTACKTGTSVTGRKWYKLLTEKGFRIIKTVCIDFTAAAPSHVMSRESFQDKIFEGVGRNVTVVFEVWRGIRSSYNGTKCSDRLTKMANLKWSPNPISKISYMPLNSETPLVASPRIHGFVEQFISEYLSGLQFITIMLRTEKLNRTVTSQPLANNNSCANRILSDWKKMVEGRNITQTLFFTDTGFHGRPGWKNLNATAFSQYIHDGLNLALSLNKLNSVLEGMIGSKDSIQIAAFHQQLVARASCVIMVGGGSFQTYALHMYAHLHKGRECYLYRSRQCNNLYIQRIYGQRSITSTAIPYHNN